MHGSSRTLAIDIETNEIDFSFGDHISRAKVIHVVSVYDGKEGLAYSPYNLHELGELFNNYDTIVGHNLIGFDIPVLYNLLNINLYGKQRIIDTLIMSRLYHPDRKEGHSIEAWGEYFGFPKSDFKDFSKYSTQLAERAIIDAMISMMIYNHLKPEFDRENLWPAYDMEVKFAKLMTATEAYGILLDKELAESTLQEIDKQINSLTEEFQSLTGKRLIPGKEVYLIYKIDGTKRQNIFSYCEKLGIDPELINGPFCGVSWDYYSPSSPVQIKELLGKLGWQPKSFTPSGAPKIDDSILQLGRIGEVLKELSGLNHRKSQVEGLVKACDPTGIIHQGANTIGTPTGRLRHRRVVNVPRVSRPFGKETRAMFKARPGKILGGYDASALELRILAHYIGNPEYISLVLSEDKEDDAHTLARDAAREVGAEWATRDTGKTINYALVYGAGDEKLGSIINSSKAVGRALRQTLMKRITGFQSFVTRVRRESQKGFLYGLDGRKLWIRSEHKDLNTLIQGGGAIYMKNVAVELDHMSFPSPYYKVIDMHDEAQWELPDNKTDKDIWNTAVNDAFDIANKKLGLRCRQAPEVKFGYNWAETH